MRVYINQYVVDETTKKRVLSKERQIVDVQLVEETAHSFWVKLPDGHIVKRKKNRDVIDETL